MSEGITEGKSGSLSLYLFLGLFSFGLFCPIPACLLSFYLIFYDPLDAYLLSNDRKEVVDPDGRECEEGLGEAEEREW